MSPPRDNGSDNGQDKHKDLDALILEAEREVIHADRHVRRQLDDLTHELHDHVGRWALYGLIGGAALAGGLVLLLRLRRPHSATLHAWRDHGTADVRGHRLDRDIERVAERAAERAARRAKTGEPLVGSLVRAALGMPSKRGMTPMLLSIAMPVLSRWWRTRERPSARRTPAGPPRSESAWR